MASTVSTPNPSAKRFGFAAIVEQAVESAVSEVLAESEEGLSLTRDKVESHLRRELRDRLMPHAERFYTTPDIASILKVAEQTVIAWRASDTGPPFVRVGRGVRYRHSDLCHWIEQNRRRRFTRDPRRRPGSPPNTDSGSSPPTTAMH